MSLSTKDIENKTFSTKFKGYNRMQVQNFLVSVASLVNNLQNENKSLNQKISKKNSKLAEYDKLKQNLLDSMLDAQSEATKVKNKAKSEASSIKNNARKKASDVKKTANKQATLRIKNASNRANEILSKSVKKNNKMVDNLSNLRKASNNFQHEIQKMLKTQLSVVRKKAWLKKLNQPIGHKETLSQVKNSSNNNLTVMRPNGTKSNK